MRTSLHSEDHDGKRMGLDGEKNELVDSICRWEFPKLPFSQRQGNLRGEYGQGET